MSDNTKRLARALGVEPRQIWQPGRRRTVLRGHKHPGGAFGMDEYRRGRQEAIQAGRSGYDYDLECMAWHSWSPDDEESYQRRLPGRLRASQDKGVMPFLEAWRASKREENLDERRNT